MRPITLAAVLSLFASMPALASGLDDARGFLHNGDFGAALSAYQKLSPASAGTVAEYAFAAAGAGFPDLALAQLDRAFILDFKDPEARFVASAVFTSMKMKSSGKELSEPAPSWLGDTVLPEMESDRAMGDYKSEEAAAVSLMKQERFVSAAARFYLLTKAFPKEPLAWAGYAVSLEELGAFKTAAKVVGRDIELNTGDDAETRQIKIAHEKELESRARIEAEASADAAPAPDHMAGRYLIFGGGSYSKLSGVETVNINTRIGKFFTDHLDAAVDLGETSDSPDSGTNGLNLGVSARYLQPVFAKSKLNATMGARLAYTPGPSNNTSFFLSPGLSIFAGRGSIDVFLDIGLDGPSKNTDTLTFGYTTYF
ncbi:MAG: hypothetical protein ACHQ49_13260 [Elusimicrobiota bacterium]